MAATKIIAIRLILLIVAITGSILAVIYFTSGGPSHPPTAYTGCMNSNHAPDEPEFHYKPALAWNEAGNLRNSVTSLEKAIQLIPVLSTIR